MSPAYLYCLMRPVLPGLEGILAGLTGIGGPVSLLDLGGLALIHGPSDGTEVLPTRRAMLAHTRVLERLMAEAQVLPMRFGLIADDLAALPEMIRSQSGLIEAEFQRLGDAAELGLRVRFPRDRALAALMAADPGLARARDALAGRGNDAYFDRIELGRRIAEALDRRRGEAQRRLLAQLRPTARDHVLRAPEEDVEVLRAEFLIPPAEADGFAARALEAARDLDFAPDAEPLIQVIGPAPAFHFIRLVLSPEGLLEAS